MSKTMSSMMNFESAQKYMFRTTTAASTMQSPSKFQSQDSQENTNVESRKQRIGRLQSVLSDKFNFSKRQAQTRESKVELNNQKFEQEKQLLMDSHLAPEEVTHVIADNRRKLALQRLRNPFIEPFVIYLINYLIKNLELQKIKQKKKQPQLQQSQSDKNLNLKGNQKKKEQQPQEETNQKQLNKKATQSNKH